jgi:hypothetical protein
MPPKATVNEQLFEAIGYRIVSHVQARDGEKLRKIGLSHACRFCGETSASKFRSVAHTIPEGLGNHWLISADECDGCNKLFSSYDDALCKSVGAILTLGGTTGKYGRVRQTGRSNGASRIVYNAESGGSHISYQFPSANDNISHSIPLEISFFSGGEVRTTTPTPNESFIPRLAYKALAKIGFAILPPERLSHFCKLQNWVMSPDDDEAYPFLDVAISTGSLGKAPEIVGATVLQKFSNQNDLPNYLFVLTAGSVCFQIELVSDDEKAQESFRFVGLPWKILLMYPKTGPVKIEYSTPTHFDWSSKSTVAVPIAAVYNYYNDETNKGRVEVVWRKMLPE